MNTLRGDNIIPCKTDSLKKNMSIILNTISAFEVIEMDLKVQFL